jgi:vitamin B12 transporter
MTLPLLACAVAAPAADGATASIIVVEDRIVTGSRLPENRFRSTVSAGVVDTEAIERRGQPVQVMDHLIAEPGVEITRTGGGPGGPTTIILRGTRSHDTAILLDGVPLADPAAPQGNPDLSYLIPAGLQRIEIAKGAQGGIYGSRAIGGVVNLIGPRPTETAAGSVLVEAGSFESLRTEAVATGPIAGGLGYAITASGMRTDGWSAQSQVGDQGDPSGLEEDGFTRLGGTARLEFPLSDGLTAYASGAVATGEDEYDGSGPDDVRSKKQLDAHRIGVGLHGSIAETRVAVDVAGTAYSREYLGDFPSQYDGSEWYGSARADQRIAGPWTLALGVDARRSEIDIRDGLEEWDRNIGGSGTVTFDDGVNRVEGTLRYDSHDREGDAVTFRIGASRTTWQERTVLHGSVANGFRTPSLYELYAPDDYGGGPIGNPDLEPQRTTTMDLGQRTRIDGFMIETVYFRTDYDEAIVFAFPAGYTNIGSGARAEGVEASVSWMGEVDDPFRVRGFATVQRSDDGNGKDLTYVPRASGGLEVGYDLPIGWANVQVKRTGVQYAGNGETEALDGRTLVNAVLGWRALEWLTVTARGENLTGVDYETFTGFGSAYTGAPRSFAIGATATW